MRRRGWIDQHDVDEGEVYFWSDTLDLGEPIPATLITNDELEEMEVEIQELKANVDCYESLILDMDNGRDCASEIAALAIVIRAEREEQARREELDADD